MMGLTTRNWKDQAVAWCNWRLVFWQAACIQVMRLRYTPQLNSVFGVFSLLFYECFSDSNTYRSARD